MVVMSSCSDDTTLEQDFEEANDNLVVVEKLITRIETSHYSGYDDDLLFLINYDENNKVTSASDGESTFFLNYDNTTDLEAIISDNYILNISKFYQVPYDAFETGEVLEYDDFGNPIEILVYNDGIDSETLIGKIFYDPNPNPFFYTLKSAGVIDLLEGININFGIGLSNQYVSSARQLLPNNNISSMIFKDANNQIQVEIYFNYDYDDDGYPISGRVYVLKSPDDEIYEIRYYYK